MYCCCCCSTPDSLKLGFRCTRKLVSCTRNLACYSKYSDILILRKCTIHKLLKIGQNKRKTYWLQIFLAEETHQMDLNHIQPKFYQPKNKYIKRFDLDYVLFITTGVLSTVEAILIPSFRQIQLQNWNCWKNFF